MKERSTMSNNFLLRVVQFASEFCGVRWGRGVLSPWYSWVSFGFPYANSLHLPVLASNPFTKAGRASIAYTFRLHYPKG